MTNTTSGEVAPTSYTHEDGITVSLAGGEQGTEPSNDETNATVEETTQKDDTQVPDSSEQSADDAQTNEAGSKVDTKASKVINSLGEDKKVFADKLIALAKSSDANKDVVADLIKEKPDVEKYFKTKFGDDYDRLFKQTSGTDSSATDFDVEKVREEERTKARAELLFEELNSKKSKALEEFAELKGFTTEEAEKLNRYAKVLEQEDEFGEELLNKAGLLVNSEKTATRSLPSSTPSGDAQPPAARKEGEFDTSDPIFQRAARQLGRQPDELAAGLQEVMTKRNDEGQYIFGL